MRFIKFGLFGISVVVIILFILYEMDIISKDKNEAIEEHLQKLEEAQEIIKEERKNKNPKENNKITKEELLERMQDSTLYFNNVQGEYVYTTISEKTKENRKEVIYIIDREHLKSKHYTINEHYELDYYVYSDENCNLHVHNIEKEYRYIPHIEQEYAGENLNEYTIDARMYDGIYKDIPGFNLVHNDVVSSTLINSLKYLADWDFEETTFLDLPSYHIEGLEGNWVEGEKFTMIVEKNTGIILDYHVYDQTGNEIMSLITKNIEIDNEQMHESIFEPDLTGYTERKIPDDVPEEYIKEELKDIDICKP